MIFGFSNTTCRFEKHYRIRLGGIDSRLGEVAKSVVISALIISAVTTIFDG